MTGTTPVATPKKAPVAMWQSGTAEVDLLSTLSAAGI